MLDLEEQNKILRRGWAAAFVLRAAIWPIDLTNFRNTSTSNDDTVNDAIFAARAVISSLQPDRIEFSVLETLILCRPEIAETMNGIRLTSRAMDTAVEILARHLAGKTESSVRVAKLMLILPILTASCPRKLANDLFAPQFIRVNEKSLRHLAAYGSHINLCAQIGAITRMNISWWK